MDKARNKLHKPGDPLPQSARFTPRTPIAIAQHILEGRSRALIDLFGVPGQMHPHATWDARTRLDCDLIYSVFVGSMFATIAGKTLSVCAGDVLWVAAGQTFRFWRQNSGKLVIHRFRLRLYERRARTRLASPFIHAVDSSEGAQTCRRIIREATHPGPDADALLSAEVATLLIHLSRRSERPTAGPGPGLHTRLSPAQRAAATDFLAKTGPTWPSVQDVAAAAGLSADYFSRLFRASLGVSVRQWIVQERIRSACLDLADPTLSVSQIATKLGYQDLFYFCRQFKKAMGVSPTRYRKRIGVGV